MAIKNDTGDAPAEVEVEDAAPGPEAAEPEQAPEADETEPKPVAPKKDKTVPLGALHESRAREREAKADAKRSQDRADRMEQRFQQMLERQNAPPAVPEPQFEQDPAAWLRHQTESTGRTVQDLARWKAQQDQERQHATADQQLTSAVTRAESEFASATPDYGAALEFAQAARLRFFRAAGMDEGEAAQTLRNETKFVALTALKRGENPAERIYKIAHELGYKASAPGATKIEQLQRGQKAASVMGGGGQSDTEVSLARLSEMDDAEFDKHWDKLKKAGKLG